MSKVSYKALFEKFRDNRVITKCQQYAKWTIPHIMADLVQTSSTGRADISRDFQEVGALLVNTLAAKLTRALFPTQYPFYQARLSGSALDTARETLSEEEIQQGLAKLEIDSNLRLFSNSGYASLIATLRHLIVTGNTLLYRDTKSAKMVVYGIQSFSCRRDGTGAMLDCILREFTVAEALPLELLNVLKAKQPSKYSRAEQPVEKYTRIHRVHREGRVNYEVSQQVDNVDVGVPSYYPDDRCPWIWPTWNIIPGEHYGRGLVDDFAGGFARLSALSEAAALYGVELMKIVHLVDAGITDIDSLIAADSGEYIRGDGGAVTAHESGDATKLQAVLGDIERVVQRLATAFMFQSNTRDAERVTAEEIRRSAEEIEITLGGVYSSLSGGLQVPLANLLMTEVSQDAEVGIALGEMRPDVIAGIPALGRSSEVQNLLLAVQEIAAVVPIAQVDIRIDPKKIVDIIFAGRSVDVSALYRSPEEVRMLQEAAAAEQQAQLELVKADTLAASGQQAQGLTG